MTLISPASRACRARVCVRVRVRVRVCSSLLLSLSLEKKIKMHSFFLYSSTDLRDISFLPKQNTFRNPLEYGAVWTIGAAFGL